MFPMTYELNFYIFFGKNNSLKVTHPSINNVLYCLTSPGGGIEYLHRSPASRRRRRKGNPVPGDTTGPPCSWGI
jgi:hypothetical protein